MANSTKALIKALQEGLAPRGAKAEFLRATGLSPSSLAGYMSGDNSPSIDQLDRIAGALGIESWELLKPADTQPAPSRDSLLAGILTRVPAIHDDQLRALFNIVDGFVRDNAETEVPKQLARKKN